MLSGILYGFKCMCLYNSEDDDYTLHDSVKQLFKNSDITGNSFIHMQMVLCINISSMWGLRVI